MNRSLRQGITSNIHRQVASYSGLELGDTILVRWWRKITALSLLLGYTTQLIGLFQYWDKGDMQVFFEALTYQAFYSMSILKLISLRTNYKRWYYLLKTASKLEEEQLELFEMNEETDNDGKFKYSERIEIYAQKFSKASNVMCKVYLTTSIMHVVGKFIENGLRKLIGFETIYRPHIVPCWALLDRFGIGGYIVSILLESVNALYSVCCHIAFDLIAMGTMIFACGQFSLLRDYSENIGFKNQLTITKRNDDLAHDKIKKCHRMHVTLQNVVKELRSLLTNLLGFYFICATIIICTAAVQLNSASGGVQMAATALYMFATSIQLFIYCYFGDQVLTASYVGVGEGPFGAAYWSLSPRLRRELTILGIGMSQPCGLYAGPTISVDLQSFIQVIRAAYSYYAFLSK